MALKRIKLRRPQIRLSLLLDNLIQFAKSGEIHERYAPESKYNISPSARKIKEAVTQKEDPMQVYTGGRPVRWHKTSSEKYYPKGLEPFGLEPVEGMPRGKPASRLKALRPLPAGKAQPYSAPKGMHWQTVKEIDVQPGEEFKEVPVYGRDRLDWKKYLRTKSGLENVSTDELWKRHREEAKGEFFSGERVGARELRTKTIRHIRGEMQRHRDYLAGEVKESHALIRAKNASLESARAHPERMVEYKQRLEDLTKKYQKGVKGARQRAGERLSRISARGMDVVAVEKEAGWQAKLKSMHEKLKVASSPEEDHSIRQQIAQHYSLRKSPEEIKSQARGAVGLLTDKPYEYGGTPLSEVNASTIQDVLEKGSKTPFRKTWPSKPSPGVQQRVVNPTERIRGLKKKMEGLYMRGVASGRGEVKKKIIQSGAVFKAPLREIAPSGYPHLGKLGLGLAGAGLLAGGAAAIIHARRKANRQQLSSRMKEMRFDLPPEAERLLNKAAKKIFEKAAKSGVSTSAEAIPGTTPKAFIPQLESQRASVVAKKKWRNVIAAISGSKVSHLYPEDMRGVRALQKTHKQNLEKIKILQQEMRTKEHLHGEALKEQAEKLGAEHAGKAKEVFSSGQRLGREEQSAVEKSKYEKKAGELAGTFAQESNKRAGRLKLVAAGTLAAGAAGGYALGRSDKGAYQRHEARQVLDMYRQSRPQPRQPRQQSHPVITIGIAGYNGKKRETQFAASDQEDEGPEWLREWAHKKLYGRSYSTLGQAQKIKKYAGRTHRIVRDLNTARLGLPNVDPRGRPRKPEWEKPWVAGALTTGALATAIIGGRHAVNFLRHAPVNTRIGQLMEGFRRGGGTAAQKVPGLGKVGGFVHGVKSELVRWRDKPLKIPPKYETSKFHPVTGQRLSEAQIAKEKAKREESEFLHKVATGKINKEEFRSRLKEIRFDKPEPLGPEAFQYAYNRPEVQKRLKHLRKSGKLPKDRYDHPDIDLMVMRYAQEYPKFSSRLREIRFSAWANLRDKITGQHQEGPSPYHDIATGAIEGGLAFPASEWAYRKVIGRGAPSTLKKIIVGGAVGGAATGLIGAGLSGFRAGKKKIKARREARQEWSSKLKEVRFQQPRRNQRMLVARDRYIKQIKQRDIDVANQHYIHSALLGAGLGAIIRKKPGSLSRAVLGGAAAGIGVQKATRIYGAGTRDPFGERSITAKRVERAPTYAGLATLGYLGLRKAKKIGLSSMARPIQFKEKWVDNPLYPKGEKRSIQEVPIKHIVSHQDAVKEGTVKKYKKRPGRAIPTLHKIGRKYYVEDGNHRIVSKMEKGEKTVRASVRELRARLREIHFQQEPRKHNVAAGLAVAAAGIPLYKGAGKFARIGLRRHIDRFLGNPVSHGKQVADYLEATQHVLNRGVTGKLAGMALRNPKHPVIKALLPGAKSGIKKLDLEHYSAFRSSPTEALDAWAGELAASMKPGKGREAHIARYQKVQGHLQKLWSKGYNEQEALRHVSTDPTHENFFRLMMKHKAAPTKHYQKITAGLAAVPATAGASVAATTRKNDGRAARQ